MVLGVACALPFVVIFGLSYRLVLIGRAHLLEIGGLSFYLLFAAIILVSVFLHELLHGVGWALASRRGWGVVGSFMILMLLIGILIGFFIPFENPLLRTACKLLCLPLVVSIGYELIKLCGRHDNLATRIIAAPGLWFQRLTVKEPDDKMIEAAIAAMEAVIPENGEDLVR